MFNELLDIITITVLCLSPSVAWANFWSRWKERSDEVHFKKRYELKEILSELEIMGNWASSEYGESAHSDVWYDPYFHVNPFQYENIKNFNYREETAIFGEKIFTKLQPLEKAINKFFNLLYQHREFYQSCDATFLNRIVHKISEEKRRTEQDRVNPLTIQGSNQLTPEEIVCVKRFYELNKAIHVQGIGTKRDPESLHSTFNEVFTFVRETLKKLKPKVYFIWAGHVLAVILFIIGIIFLIAFVIKFPKILWGYLTKG